LILSRCDTSAVARLGTPLAGGCVPSRQRSRFVDGLLPLACGQSVHNSQMRTTRGASAGPRSMPGGSMRFLEADRI